jgi:hypothetical protein
MRAAIIALLLAPIPAQAAFDGAAPLVRAEALIYGSGLFDVRPLVIAPPPAAVPFLAPAPAPALFPTTLWESLPPLGTAEAAEVAALDSGVQPAQVREIPFAAADAVVAAAVARGLASLDLFSDAGLRLPRIYYIPASTLALLYKKYAFGVAAPAEGVGLDGAPFHSRGVLAGAGAVRIFYGQDLFRYAFAEFPGFQFEFKREVDYSIRGDSDLAVSGMRADRGTLSVSVQRLSRSGPSRMKVETSVTERDFDLKPIRLAP